MVGVAVFRLAQEAITNARRHARQASQIAVVELPADLPRPRVGDVVAVVPNHACPVVNLTDELVLTRAGEAVERLPVLAPGRTS